MQHYGDRFKMASLPQAYAPRHTLVRMFQLAAMKPYVYVSGPSGSGKTISTRLWLEESGREAIWIGLDKSNDSLASFYSLFCMGLCSAQPDNIEMEAILKNEYFGSAPVEHAIRIASAFKPGSRHYAIVLDNLQMVQRTEVRKSLSSVLAALHGSIVVVLLTQEPFASIRLTEAERQSCTHIDASDLAFAPEEVRILYRAHGQTITAHEAQAICSFTGGLAINVMALASGSGRTGKQSRNKLLETCFEEDYWSRWDDATKGFLVKTSIVEEVTPRLAQLLTEVGDARSILDKLASETFFVSKVGEETYRYHHLMRSYLYGKITDDGRKTIDALHIKAAEYYYGGNDVFLARRYAMLSGNTELIAKTSFEMSSSKGTISTEEFINTYRAFLDLVDHEELCKQHPYLYSQFAGYFVVLGKADEAYRCFDELTKRLRTIAVHHTRFLPDALLIMLIDPRKKLGNTIAAVSKLPFLPNLSDRLEWSTITGQLPFAHRSGRDYSEFFDDEAIKQGGKVAASLLGERGFVLASMIRAGLLWEQNRLDEAMAILNDLRGSIRKIVSNELVFCHLIQSAALYNTMKIEGLFNEAITQAEAFVNNLENACFQPNFEAFKARLALTDGNREAAREWLDRYYVIDAEYIEQFRYYCRFTTVRAYLVLGMTAKAETNLEKLKSTGCAFNRPLDVAEALVLQTALDWALGKRKEATDRLTEALVATQADGAVRVIADEGAAVLPALKQVKAHAGKDDGSSLTLEHLNKVIASAREQAVRTRGVTYWIAPQPVKLSKQQKRILSLVAQGRKNAEIASETGLALSTVKFHLQEAYRKLDVNNAEDAVQRAREGGLLQGSSER